MGLLLAVGWAVVPAAKDGASVGACVGFGFDDGAGVRDGFTVGTKVGAVVGGSPSWSVIAVLCMSPASKSRRRRCRANRRSPQAPDGGGSSTSTRMTTTDRTVAANRRGYMFPKVPLGSPELRG